VSVTVTVVHYVDGTVTEVVLTGARISTQLWGGGRALIKVFDAKGDRVRCWHGSQVFTIDKIEGQP
jgi:hypothetical protein